MARADSLRVEVRGVTGEPARVNQLILVTGISGVYYGVPVQSHTRAVLARTAADLLVM